jgi:hypothetical protein
MELFDVSYGDSYEHRSIGLALSMDGARDLARAFLRADESEALRCERGMYWFEVTSRRVGEVSDMWTLDEGRLAL